MSTDQLTKPGAIQSSDRKPLRLLHVVEYMHDQAVENWLFRIMRDSRERYPDYHWTFYCALGRPGRLDDAVRALGGNVIHSPFPLGNKAAFGSALRAEIKRGGYDVMHAHHDIVSSVYLLAAAGTGIRRRIVHVHNTSMDLPTSSEIKKRMMWEPMRQIVLTMADRIAGISHAALASMLVDAPPKPGRDVVVYYGIDTSRIASPRSTRAGTRASIGVGEKVPVLLFAGRMTEYKNPRFLVEVLKEVSRTLPDAVAVFAGTGPESDAVVALAAEKGLSDRIRVLGWRDDLPELMLAADVLVSPGQENPKEGLGLGVVEAQAAGLPVIMSRSVPEDAIVIREIVSVIPLAQGAAVWAKEILRRVAQPRPDPSNALAKTEASHFSLRAGTDNVMALYEGLADG